MLNKLKFTGIIFLSILLLTNCKKENKQDKIQQGELVFSPIEITPDKGVWDWECDLELTVVYALVIIDGEEHYPLTFVLDGKLYTQAIKLDAGEHVLEYFALMDDMGTPEDKTDDEIVKAIPMDESEFAQYVEYTLPKPLTIVAFQKFELKINVLCYIPEVYEYFGFIWFEVNEITIREQCFFGDFCLPSLTEYDGSLYALNGLFVDEVAIFMIRAYRDDEMLGEFYNTYEVEEELLFKEPLCIQYADYDNAENHFKFELWIYVKVGEDFEYILFHTWEFMDDEKIDNGGDGVVEFVLGDCVYTETDLLLSTYVPFIATFEVTIDTVLHFPPPLPKIQEVLGTGNVTHLGNTDLYILQNWWPPHAPPLIPPYTGTGTGEVIFTAANGDLLFASYDDAEGFHDIAPPVIVTFTGHFNGGTGRFEHATGYFDWYGEFFPATNTGTATCTGEIMYIE